MKHPKLVIGLTVCVVAIGILAYTPIKRLRQNNASVAMLRFNGDLRAFVETGGTFPRSWDDLYPPGMENRKDEISWAVIVNWNITIEEIMQYIKQRDPGGRITRESEVPFIVRYSDRVPHDLIRIQRDNLERLDRRECLLGDDRVRTVERIELPCEQRSRLSIHRSHTKFTRSSPSSAGSAV